MEAYFKASRILYISTTKNYTDVLRESQSKTWIKLPSKERKRLKLRGNRTLEKHADIVKTQKFGRK